MVDRMEDQRVDRSEGRLVVRKADHLEGHSEGRKADYLEGQSCLLYTSPSPRDRTRSRMPSSA